MDITDTTGNHNYTNIGKPFQMGERWVCMANEVLGADMNAETVSIRRVILDAETGKEIEGPIDLGSHVIHPEPGRGYVYYSVIEAEEKEE